MAEMALRRSPFVDLTLPGVRHRVSVEVAPPALRFVFRGGADAVAQLGAAFGVEPNLTACRATQSADGRACLWLGPDEWLLLAPDGDAAALAASLSGAVTAPHSLVDVSHRQTGVVLKGTRAVDVLNGACPLDLAEAAFPVGMCTRTLYGKAEIVLWRTRSDTFRIEVWRSFAAYLVGLIGENAREHQV